MLRILLGVGVLCALSIHAYPDDFTFRIKSLYKFSAQVEYRSQARNAAWPGDNAAWDLADDAIHEHKLNCRSGEKICFGAWDKGSGQPQWGRGRDGNRDCGNCCWICENGRRTPVITLRTRRIKKRTIPFVSLESSEPRLVTVSRTSSFGGPGGGNYEISCPFGTVMIGLRARHGSWIDALAPICAKYIQNTLAEVEPQPFTGGSGGGEAFMRCAPPRGVVVGLELFQANNKHGSVGHIIVNCGDYFDPSRFANKLPGSAVFLGNSQRGSRTILKCAPPLVAGGIFGRSGTLIDRVGLTCVDYQPRR